jgi:hypothetical protein
MFRSLLDMFFIELLIANENDLGEIDLSAGYH